MRYVTFELAQPLAALPEAFRAQRGDRPPGKVVISVDRRASTST